MVTMIPWRSERATSKDVRVWDNDVGIRLLLGISLCIYRNKILIIARINWIRLFFYYIFRFFLQLILDSYWKIRLMIIFWNAIFFSIIKLYKCSKNNIVNSCSHYLCYIFFKIYVHVRKGTEKFIARRMIRYRSSLIGTAGITRKI